MCIDHNVNRTSEDCEAASTGSSGKEDRSLLGIWSSCTSPFDGNFHPDSTLACMHLVRVQHSICIA